MTSNRYFICYAPGTGGNFITRMVEYMIYGHPIDILLDGSAHGKIFNARSALEGLVTNISPKSYEEEFRGLQNLSNHSLFYGHCRNIALLTREQFKTIYIRFSPQDFDQIYRNATAKIRVYSKKSYEILKGPSWPDWNDSWPEQVGKDILPIWIINEINKRYLDILREWYWCLPSDEHSENLLGLNFSEITSDQYLDRLANFVQAKYYDKDYLTNIIKEYVNRQPKIEFKM